MSKKPTEEQILVSFSVLKDCVKDEISFYSMFEDQYLKHIQNISYKYGIIRGLKVYIEEEKLGNSQQCFFTLRALQQAYQTESKNMAIVLLKEFYILDVLKNVALYRKEDQSINRGRTIFEKDKQYENYEELGEQFLILTLELLEILAHKFPQTSKKQNTKFKEVYEYLKQQNVKFPDNYQFFESKDKPQQYNNTPQPPANDDAQKQKQQTFKRQSQASIDQQNQKQSQRNDDQQEVDGLKVQAELIETKNGIEGMIDDLLYLIDSNQLRQWHTDVEIDKDLSSALVEYQQVLQDYTEEADDILKKVQNIKLEKEQQDDVNVLKQQQEFIDFYIDCTQDLKQKKYSEKDYIINRNKILQKAQPLFKKQKLELIDIQQTQHILNQKEIDQQKKEEQEQKQRELQQQQQKEMERQKEIEKQKEIEIQKQIQEKIQKERQQQIEREKQEEYERLVQLQKERDEQEEKERKQKNLQKYQSIQEEQEDQFDSFNNNNGQQQQILKRESSNNYDFDTFANDVTNKPNQQSKYSEQFQSNQQSKFNNNKLGSRQNTSGKQYQYEFDISDANDYQQKYGQQQQIQSIDGKYNSAFPNKNQARIIQNQTEYYGEQFSVVTQSVMSATSQQYPLKDRDLIDNNNYEGVLVDYDDRIDNLLQKYNITPSILRKFKIANLKQKYLLVDNNEIQIGKKSDLIFDYITEKYHLIITLFIGNKTQKDINNLKLEYFGDKSAQIWVKQNSDQNDQNMSIKVGQQIKQEIIFQYKQIPYEIVNGEYSSSLQQNKNIVLPFFLPTLLTNFMQFKQTSELVYMQRWQKMKRQNYILKSPIFTINTRIIRHPSDFKQFFDKSVELTSVNDFLSQKRQNNNEQLICYELGGIFELNTNSEEYLLKITVKPNLKAVIQIITHKKDLDNKIAKNLINQIQFIFQK